MYSVGKIICLVWVSFLRPPKLQSEKNLLCARKHVSLMMTLHSLLPLVSADKKFYKKFDTVPWVEH